MSDYWSEIDHLSAQLGVPVCGERQTAVRVPYTEAKKELAKEMRAAGASYQEIAVACKLKYRSQVRFLLFGKK